MIHFVFSVTYKLMIKRWVKNNINGLFFITYYQHCLQIKRDVYVCV